MNRCNEAVEQVFPANPIIEKNKELIVRITKAVARLIATLTVFTFCSFGDSGDWRTMNGGAFQIQPTLLSGLQYLCNLYHL